MQRLLVLVFAILAATAFGPSAIPAAAQSGGHPAYVIAEIHVTDPAGFMEYMRQLPATLAPYHGRTLARALPDVREGAQPQGDIFIFAFNSLQDANHWYNSGYSKLAALQQKAATSRVYIVDGLGQ